MNPNKNISAVSLAFILIVIVALTFPQVASSQGAPKSASPKKPTSQKAPAASAAPTRVKVAEGRYEVVGGKADAQNSYTEPWTLYKTNVGYDLQEQWMVASAGGAESRVDVSISFAPGLYPIQVQVGALNSQQRLLCSMALKEFKCFSQGKESKLAMQGAYNVFLPSPWMLGSIARRAKKIPNQSARVQLMMMAP